MERPTPCALELSGELVFPIVADDLVRAALGLVGQRREDLVGGLTGVERRDQRLHDRSGPVEGARVAPGLEEVRFRDVPVAERGGLVLVRAEMDPETDLVERARERNVGRRREDGVAAENDQRLHQAVLHVGDELLQRIDL